MEEAKALWHLSSTESQILPTSLPTSEFTLLDITSHYSLISCGTERLVATGFVPAELRTTMRVPEQEGDFDFPIKYGYSLVGEVQAVQHPWHGKNVHLLHPHQTHCRVAESALFLIPDTIPPLRATLASNMETAVNALWDAEVQVGDRVLVAGFGIIGALTAQVLAEIPAIDLWVLEKSEERIVFAKELGFRVLEDFDQVPAFDLAFHTTSQEAGLQFCIDHLGFGGKVIEMSWYGAKKIQIHLGGSFHQERKQLISSQVGHLPAKRSERWDFRRRKEVVFKLLTNPVFDQYLNTIIPFTEAPAFFEELRQGKLGGLGVCLEY